MMLTYTAPEPQLQREISRSKDFQAKNIPIWDKVIVTAKTEYNDMDWMHAFCLEQ